MMFLTHDELVDLTNKQRRDAQIRALRYMGIEHRIRPDGSVAVLRVHVEQLLGAASPAKDKAPKEFELEW